MKALVILAVLAAVLLLGLSALLKESDADLRRVESEIRQALDGADGAVREAAATLAPLRSIRPNMIRLDQALVGLRTELEAARRRLDTLESRRPDAGSVRTPWVEERQKERAAAEALAARANDLRERVALVDQFTRETQPKLSLLLSNTALLHQSRAALVARKAPTDPELLVKIDQLGTEAEAARRLATDVLEAAVDNVEQARVLAATAAREIDRILAEQGALAARVNG